MSASMRRRMSISELEDRIDAVERAQTDDCREIVDLAGFDPGRDLRFGDFAECKFDGQKLRGFDFTGCDLRGSTFDGAWIETVNLDGAMFDPAALQKATDYNAFLERDLGRDPSTRYRVDATRIRDLAIFREVPFAPEMVVLPAGEYDMGSDLGDAKLGVDDRANADEILPLRGKRRIRIPRRFAIGRYPVTFEEYDVFCDASRRKRPKDEGDWGRGRRPVVNVSWDGAQAYIAWLNAKFGAGLYRLPSEAEWEYACRAGTNTRRWWGDSWDATQANGAESFEGGRTSPVGRYPGNPWELRDMIGNVWEWCADEWTHNVGTLPEDGVPSGNALSTTVSSRTKKQSNNDESVPRALRGGCWASNPRNLRSAIRYRAQPDDRYDYIGFRLSRTL